MSATIPLQSDQAASASRSTSVPSMERDIQALKEKYEASSFPKGDHLALCKPDYLLGECMSIWVAGYWASLIRAGIMIPGISSVILVLLNDLSAQLTPLFSVERPT